MGAFHKVDAVVAAKSGVAITPSDATVIPVTRGVYVGVGGDITAVLAEDSSTILFSSVPQGVVLPIQAKQIYSTGTTASALVALY